MKPFVMVCLFVLMAPMGLLPSAHATERGLGPWTLNPHPLPFPHHRGFATCTYGDLVYIFGGDSTGAATGHMDYVGFARVESDLTLGPWTETTSIPNRAWMPEVIRYGDKVYLMGGYVNGGSSGTYAATIQPDNTLGAWQPQSSLPTGVYGHTSVLNGDQIYVLGNWNGNAVYHAQILPGGDLGPWQSTTPLPANLYASDAAIHDGKLFVFGGKEIVGGVQTVVPYVRFAQIQPDGNLGSWMMTDAMPSERWFHQVEISDDHVFVVGGSINAGPTADVAEGEIMPDASIQWAVASQLPNPTSGNGLAQVNGHLYYLPGQWDDVVYYAEIEIPQAVEPLSPAWCHLETWPNPCFTTMRSRIHLPCSEHVRVTLCDAAGREVTVLADREMVSGDHWLQWSGVDQSGTRVPGGVYLLRLAGESLRGSSRVVVLR
jgi:hypothetical protein